MMVEGSHLMGGDFNLNADEPRKGPKWHLGGDLDDNRIAPMTIAHHETYCGGYVD